MNADSKQTNAVLTEFESKLFLKPYGVSVVDEVMAKSVAEAVKAAEKIGFPIVLKGLGKELLHKTELQLVHLNLNDAAAVEAAAKTIE